MAVEDTGRQPHRRRARARAHPDQIRRDSRRSFVLTVLALVPGAGLLGTRYRRLGWIMLVVLVVGIVGVALYALAKGAFGTALSIAVRPDTLLAIAGLTIVGALVWIFSIILTHRGTLPARADTTTRVGLQLVTALICLVVAVPAFQVVRYSLIQRDLVSTVFTGPSLGGITPSARQTWL